MTNWFKFSERKPENRSRVLYSIDGNRVIHGTFLKSYSNVDKDYIDVFVPMGGGLYVTEQYPDIIWMYEPKLPSQ